MAATVTLAEYNELLAHCGCCPVPRCCPPVLDCQSGFAVVNFTGFIKPDESGDSDSDGPYPMPARYQRKVLEIAEHDDQTELPHPDGGTYVSQTITGSGYYRLIYEFSSMLEVSISGAYFAGACYYESPQESDGVCEYGGTRTQSDYALHSENGAWVRYKAVQVDSVYSSAAGERTEAHIAWKAAADQWDLDHPDYENEHATWQTAYDTWNAWYNDREVWVAADPENRTYEDFPEADPGEPGAEPPPRPEEPAEFYGPCTMKRVDTTTAWERKMVDGTWTSVLVDPAELDQETNPYTITYYGSTRIGEWWHGNMLHGPAAILPVSWQLPMTHAEFQAEAAAWITANIHRIYDAADISGIDSSSPACEPGSGCAARREISPDITDSLLPQDFVTEDFFRYRYKLNKCCGYKRILSAWREVFFPQAYLDWYASLEFLGSDETPSAPPADLDALAARKQWLWEGEPPLCPENEDSATSNDTDPYDHQPMWSPWSALVRVPAGEQGLVVLRNYLQYCGYPLPDLMPDVTGHIDLSDSQPDGTAI
jgi:hypothetical protein